MSINWLIYFAAYMLGAVCGAPLFGLALHDFKFKNKKIVKLMGDLDKAVKYDIEGIHRHREDTYIYRYVLPYVNTTIELDMHAKNIRIIHKPAFIDEIQLFEHITLIQTRVHNYESVNETMTRLLT